MANIVTGITNQKRKRSANWDETEKNLLRECLKDVLHIIENKCTDTNTNKTKSLTWQQVMKSFNEINERERSLIELKQQWRTMKMEAKKCNSDYKKSLKATGGGMKPPSPDPQTVEIMEMLPQEFEEDINMFDSDTIAQESISTNIKADVPLKINKDVLIEIKDENTPTQESCPNVGLQSTPISLRRCTKTLEGSQSSKRRKCRIESETENILNRNTAIIQLMQAEHELKMKQMAEAHGWASEEHKLKCENLKLKNLLLLKQISQLNE